MQKYKIILDGESLNLNQIENFLTSENVEVSKKESFDKMYKSFNYVKEIVETVSLFMV